MATTNNLTDYGEETTARYWQSQTLYAALMSAAGGEAGPGTEFNAADYERIPVVWAVDSESEDTISNDVSAIEFGTPAANWGTAVEVRLFDALSGGNAWFYYTIDPGVACDAGAPVRIPVGSLSERAQ